MAGAQGLQYANPNGLTDHGRFALTPDHDFLHASLAVQVPARPDATIALLKLPKRGSDKGKATVGDPTVAPPGPIQKATLWLKDHAIAVSSGTALAGINLFVMYSAAEFLSFLTPISVLTFEVIRTWENKAVAAGRFVRTQPCQEGCYRPDSPIDI